MDNIQILKDLIDPLDIIYFNSLKLSNNNNIENIQKDFLIEKNKSLNKIFLNVLNENKEINSFKFNNFINNEKKDLFETLDIIDLNNPPNYFFFKESFQQYCIDSTLSNNLNKFLLTPFENKNSINQLQITPKKYIKYLF